ncbi:MAG TPA: hypothetical protein ENL07_09320 [Chlorobaculum parvum]|uniref:Uncharacterized protein n=1 Tax=Chlorobaculum parvum TaxID=274539 RepID=A0A7C5HD11_9CHLB|nr:hypothetical protein [Chlorobaculum parvum]HHE32799.1 hypothetical protein [Chlorobaculum parvum]
MNVRVPNVRRVKTLLNMGEILSESFLILIRLFDRFSSLHEGIIALPPVFDDRWFAALLKLFIQNSYDQSVGTES